jgi:phosphoglycerate dehydrogenase-like enzyme
MNKTCFLGIDMHPEAEAKLKAHFRIAKDAIDLAVSNAAIVYSPDPAWDFSVCKKMRIIACHSSGGEDINIRCRKNNIEIFESTRIWRTVAEHAMALLLSAIRNIPQADRDIKDGLWKNHSELKIKHSGLGMYGKTAGIWGLGKIGKSIVPMLNAFGINTIYNDIKRLSNEEEKELGVGFRALDDFLASVDYLFVLLPLTIENRNIMDEKLFAKIKRGTVLVNVARAGLIKESAFKIAVEQGILYASALDVLWNEGTDQPEWITDNKKIITVPHLGGSTRECDLELVDHVINAVAAAGDAHSSRSDVTVCTSRLNSRRPSPDSVADE